MTEEKMVAVLAKLEEKVEQITRLVKEARELAEKYDLDFSLVDLDLRTTDEISNQPSVQDSWQDSWVSSDC